MKGLYYTTEDDRIGRVDDMIELSGATYARVYWMDDHTVTFEEATILAEDGTFYSSFAEARATIGGAA